MTDTLYWDFYELLSIELDREPTYEEVQERIQKEFTITKDEEVKYHQERVYGK
jgi:hypothetical protein